MSEIWLTKRELAAQLRVSVRTIERLRLPAMRVGGQNRYLMSQVEWMLLSETGELPANVVPLRSQAKGEAA